MALAPFGIRAPLWSGTTLCVNPAVSRTAEAEGNADASEFVSILGVSSPAAQTGRSDNPDTSQVTKKALPGRLSKVTE
jgi:hypothetical protein